jgi:hypothetical protein
MRYFKSLGRFFGSRAPAATGITIILLQRRMARSAQVLVPTETPFHAPMLNNNENARKEVPKTFNEF